jgi:hypothetical protein
MKITLMLVALFGFTALAPAADKKDDKSDRKNKKEKKEEKKEEVRNLFEVTVTGAKDEAAESDVKTFLGSIEGVRLDKAEKTEKGMEAVLSSTTKISRADVSKALKDNRTSRSRTSKRSAPAVRRKRTRRTTKRTTRRTRRSRKRRPLRTKSPPEPWQDPQHPFPNKIKGADRLVCSLFFDGPKVRRAGGGSAGRGQPRRTTADRKVPEWLRH